MKRLLGKYLPPALGMLSGMLLALTLLAGCKAGGPAVTQPTATNAAVQITLQNAHYGVSEPVGVLIKNAGTTNVYVLDGQASCTILGLQQYAPQQRTWASIDRCRDTIQPQVLLIRAGMSEPFTLAPGSSADPNAWAPGTYRIAVKFSASPDGTTAAQTAYSQGFTIGNA